MTVSTDRFTSLADFGGDTESYSVRTSCVTPLKPLAIALWLMLTEQVKRLVEQWEIRWAFVSGLWQTFLQWITQENDDQH